ncbi:Holliday junction branch migration protein RuvA [Anaeroglobus geminatus]|jgi:Holliday junction DNA helicase RuvA|uniref:Holliday junction branch migration complex subunit RuvA n=1 Tax=Anaeroglobus geminatus F0357 TaxID=861450 RepID=G9YFE5_9FIRM|nr:Holliday junction branch migration protein RuvA [Anaeroglobus geminatus]EHM43112.1 Holliday junction DNA helicase RuvA [Anaeroglobus geminatus F0357]
MIGYVKGIVTHIFLSSAFVNVHGVGYRVHAPVSTLSRLAVGEEALLFTYMNVREDAVVLYGFLTQDEYDLFMLLIGVNGVGPKVANGILSADRTDRLRLAVANKEIGVLTKMPGIGKKTAERIVLELQDKIGTGDGAAGTAASAEPAVSGIGDEVTAALTGLGYSVQEAGPVVERLAPDYETVEDLLRACLRALGTGR